MEKEISSGAMLGIVLIALAAIIGIGFGVFAIAKGTANTGVTNVQEKLESVSQSDYTDYDQTIVTGTQVKSAYDNFAGKSAAVLIATQAVKDKTENTGGLNAKAAGLGAYGYTGSGSSKTANIKNIPVVSAYAEKPTDNGTSISGTVYSMTKSTGDTDDAKKVQQPIFINYNALLAQSEDQEKSSVDNNSYSWDKNPYIYFDTNCFRCVSGYNTKAGKVQFNYITGNLSKSGMCEYLPTSARFQSYLIKDASGTTLGVAFEQISSK